MRNLYCGGWISTLSSIFSCFHFYFPTTQSGQWAKIWKIVIKGISSVILIWFLSTFWNFILRWWSEESFLKEHIFILKKFSFSAHFGFASHTFLFLEAERDINLKNPILERAYPTNMALNKKASIFLSFLYKKFKNRGMCVRVVTKV